MINFLKYRWLYFLISTLVIGVGIFSLLVWGFNYSIDFVGGTNLDYQADKIPDKKLISKIIDTEEYGLDKITIKDNTISLKLKPLNEEEETRLRKNLETELNTKLTVLKFESLGPLIGRETIKKTVIASILAIIGILLYMSFAFRNWYFALSSIIALLHDFLVVVGTYSLFSHFFGAEVDLLFVTALLTTMSFSVHDTIVIFDKIREYIKEQKNDIADNANLALTETLVRSVNNSMTIIFMLMALILMGGTSIRFFVMALLVGTITGTYSSPFVATPFLVWLTKKSSK